MTNETSDIVRLNVNIHRDVADALRYIADRNGTHSTEAVRRAISIAAFIYREIDVGNTVLVQEKGSRGLREVVLP